MPDIANIDLPVQEDGALDAGQAFVQVANVDAVFIPVIEVISNPPTLSGWSPATGSAITKEQPLSFAVAPAAPNDASAMRRVVLFAHFPTIDLYEVVHDGDGFAQAYPETQGNVRAANGLGYTFTVLRKEGWPASPRLIPMAVDVYGAVNPISNTIYAWTLI